MNTTPKTSPQSHPNKQHSKKETDMKAIVTIMVALVAALTTLAPLNAWAKPTPQCIKLSQELGKNCKDDKLLADFAKAKCSDEMKNDVCPPAPAEASKAPAKVEEKPALAEIKDAPKATEKLDCSKSVVLTGVSLIDNSKRLLFCFEQRKSDCEASLGDITAAQTETATTFIKKKVQANLVQKMKDAVNSVSPAVEACVTQSGSRIEDMKLMTNLLESMPSGNTILGIPADLKGHTVEFTLNDGSTVEGEVLEIGDDTVKVKLADGTTKDLKKSDIKGFSKIKVIDNVKPGDSAKVTDRSGHSITGVVKKADRNGVEVEATGAIERGTGLPIKVTLEVVTMPISVGGSQNINGNLHGISLWTGWGFRLGEGKKLFLEPGITAKAVAVTGASPERLGDIPAERRWGAMLGIGTKFGFDLDLGLSPYAVVEGYAFPSLGVSGGLGAQYHLTKSLALDASIRYTWLDDSKVPRGTVASLTTPGPQDMRSLRVGALGFTLGVSF